MKFLWKFYLTGITIGYAALFISRYVLNLRITVCQFNECTKTQWHFACIYVSMNSQISIYKYFGVNKSDFTKQEFLLGIIGHGNRSLTVLIQILILTPFAVGTYPNTVCRWNLSQHCLLLEPIPTLFAIGTYLNTVCRQNLSQHCLPLEPISTLFAVRTYPNGVCSWNLSVRNNCFSVLPHTFSLQARAGRATTGPRGTTLKAGS